MLSKLCMVCGEFFRSFTCESWLFMKYIIIRMIQIYGVNEKKNSALVKRQNDLQNYLPWIWLLLQSRCTKHRKLSIWGRQWLQECAQRIQSIKIRLHVLRTWIIQDFRQSVSMLLTYTLARYIHWYLWSVESDALRIKISTNRRFP